MAAKPGHASDSAVRSEGSGSIQPWAFIAHKDGCWAGVASATMPKKDLRKFLGDFAADGFAIMTVNNRDEYNAVLASMKFWREHEQAPAPTAHGTETCTTQASQPKDGI